MAGVPKCVYVFVCLGACVCVYDSGSYAVCVCVTGYQGGADGGGACMFVCVCVGMRVECVCAYVCIEFERMRMCRALNSIYYYCFTTGRLPLVPGGPRYPRGPV